MLLRLLSHLPGASGLIDRLSEFIDALIQYLAIYDSDTVYIGQSCVLAMGRVSKPISYIISKSKHKLHDEYDGNIWQVTIWNRWLSFKCLLYLLSDMILTRDSSYPIRNRCVLTGPRSTPSEIRKNKSLCANNITLIRRHANIPEHVSHYILLSPWRPFHQPWLIRFSDIHCNICILFFSKPLEYMPWWPYCSRLLLT